MSADNKYLEEVLPNLYRRQAMHTAIFVFIDLYRFLYESVTLEEAAKAFIKRYKVDEELFAQETIIAIYYRVNKDLNDMHRQKNKDKAFPIKL